MRMYLATAGLLALLVVLAQLVLGAQPYDTLALVSVVLTVAAWVAAVIMYRAKRLRANGVVAERALVATRDAIVATLVMLIALRRLLGLQEVVPGELASIGLVAALLAVCLYPVRLLLWYYRGDFD